MSTSGLIGSDLARRAEKDPEQDEDELFGELEDDSNEPAWLRERRLEQLHKEFQRVRTLRDQDHGTYMTVTSEKEVLDLTTSTKLSIVHFFKTDFRRCRIMDAHLKLLADWHLETRFVRADVEKHPWLVERLNVKVLPCAIAFIDGQVVDRVLGFEGVGRGTDAITTAELESRLVAVGVLTSRVLADEPAGKTRYDGVRNGPVQESKQYDEDYDDDWD